LIGFKPLVDGDLGFQGGPKCAQCRPMMMKGKPMKSRRHPLLVGEGRWRCTDEYVSLRTGEQLPVKPEEHLSVVLEVAFHSVGRPSP
jgi:hypothetical protein